MFSYSFTNRFGAFAEYALVLPEEGDNVQFIDAGVTYLAKERLQFDAIYIHRLAGKSNYNELKVGISFRLME